MEHFLTQLLLSWLARRYPAPELSEDGPALGELALKYEKWDIPLGFLSVVLWFAISAAIGALLHYLAVSRAQFMQDDATTFVFFADRWALWLPSMVIAFPLSIYALSALLMIILRDRYAECERYGALKYRFDQRLVVKRLTQMCAVLYSVAIVILLDTYMVAAPNRLRVNPFLGVERSYAYTDINEIVTAPALIAPSGNKNFRRSYLLKFKDGTTFSLTEEGTLEFELLHRSHADVIKVISKRSGVRPIERPVFEWSEL